MVSNANFIGLGNAPASPEPVALALGEWLPDLPEVSNAGALEALNVIPNESGYVPFPQFTPSGDGLPGRVRGAALLFSKASKPSLYAADVNGIYQRLGNSFYKRYTTAFPLYVNYLWRFVSFGDYVVALHPQVTPQASDVGGASPFTPLGGSPPIAACGSRVGDFLVLGNLDNENDPDGARQPQRIRWSAFDNIDGPWISDPATQADFQDMPSEGGPVMGITGREFGTIFQERIISRMTYVGLPTVFDIQTVEQARGALCVGGIVDIGTTVYFIASDGFYVWNGTNSQPIAQNKVNRWFFNKLSYAARTAIIGVYDYVNNCILWAFPSNTDGVLDNIIIYSVKEDRWSHVELSVDFLVSAATLDVSMDDLTGNLDSPVDFPVSLDDGRYRGGVPVLAGFSTTHGYGTFTGAPMAATLDTSEYATPNNQRINVIKALPDINVAAGQVGVALGLRDQMIGEPIVWTDSVVQELTGECPVMGDAHYLRARISVPAGLSWRHSRSITLWRKALGLR